MSLIIFLGTKLAEVFGLALGRPLELIDCKMKNPRKLEFPHCFFVMLLGRKWAPNPQSMKVQSMMVILKKVYGSSPPGYDFMAI